MLKEKKAKDAGPLDASLSAFFDKLRTLSSKVPPGRVCVMCAVIITPARSLTHQALAHNLISIAKRRLYNKAQPSRLCVSRYKMDFRTPHI